jgi:hypothetical protein
MGKRLIAALWTVNQDDVFVASTPTIRTTTISNNIQLTDFNQVLDHAFYGASIEASMFGNSFLRRP